MDGNLVSHPGLLPLGHLPVTDSAAEYISSQLPDYARLQYDATPASAFDPNDGSEYLHHGYSIVAADGAAVDKPGELRVSMSGRYLDNVDMTALAAYLLIVRESYGLRCSRVDVALDDHEKRFPLELVEKARCDRHYFNVRSTSVVNSDDIYTNTQGQTVYFGSRQSDAFMRVYDKTAESKGARVGNRWEAEFKGKKADLLFSQWLSAMEDDERRAGKLLVNVVLGTVDFRDKSKGDKNRKRCPVLPWFAEMCDVLSSAPVRLRVAKPKQSLQRTVDYLKRSVAPSLACLVKAMGCEFPGYFRKLVSDGDRRMSNIRRKISEDADISQLCY
jgi:phage replication initiation protein